MIKLVQGVLLSILATSLLVIAVNTLPVKAQNAPAEITLSPAKTTLDYKLSANTTYKESFKLMNSGQTTATVQITTTPYSVQDSAYTPDFSKYNNYNQLSRWISFPVDSYSLEPGQEVSVSYQINTPNSLPDGDQYAMLMASMSGKDSSQSGAKVETKSQVGVKLIAHTTGKVDENVKVDLPKLPLVVIGNKYQLSFSFHNQGNVDYNSEYSVRVTNLINSQSVLNKTSSVQVIPETTRSLNIPWVILANIGLYRVELSAATTEGMATTSKNVLALTPLGLIALLVLSIIIMALIIRLTIKPRVRRNRLKRPK